MPFESRKDRLAREGFEDAEFAFLIADRVSTLESKGASVLIASHIVDWDTAEFVNGITLETPEEGDIITTFVRTIDAFDGDSPTLMMYGEGDDPISEAFVNYDLTFVGTAGNKFGIITQNSYIRAPGDVGLNVKLDTGSGGNPHSTEGSVEIIVVRLVLS